jgi:hypothetical protein
MNLPNLIEGTFTPARRQGAARREDNGADASASASLPPPRIPRLARLMALAWHIEGLVRAGAISNYAAAARLGHVSRARLSQILSLLNLDPDLQEQLLFLQRPSRGRTAPVLRQVLPVAAALDWDEQRRRWRRLQRANRPRRPTILDA